MSGAATLEAPSLGTLQRHTLVRLHAEAWRQLLASDRDGEAWDAQARDCLAFWSARDLPLVVTRQPPGCRGSGDDTVTLGLAAPADFGRRRLFLRVPAAGLGQRADFPPASTIGAALAAAVRAHWAARCADLAALGLAARVYGSHGWQVLTGLRHVHAGSDIDLLVPVADRAQADAAIGWLERAETGLPRIDGELVFGDAAAVAWREWAAWRTGRATRVLVKRLDGAALARGEEVCGG